MPAIELPAQILDSNTIEAFVDFDHEPASSRLNLREILLLESLFTPLRGRMTGSNWEPEKGGRF
ncbi:MAG: hypothetical protein GY856_50225 [bacterium]|nr:hypothetical protein [bacterium]